MKIKWHFLVLVALTGLPDMASSRAITGKIIINQTYSSGSSDLIQGSGNVITEKRKLNGFSKLSISAAVDIEYFASENYSLELTADDNIVPIITSTIVGDTLIIDTNQSYSTQSKLRASIYGPSTLKGVKTDGSSDVNLQGIASDMLEINLEGSSDFTVQGKVQNLHIKTSGRSEINAKELLATNVTINTKGNTDAIVTVNKNLDIVLNGISDITYYGHPESITKTIDGIGNVTAGD